MTLQHTDFTYSQLSPGASMRPPEIFLPIKAQQQCPEFWGYPETFKQVPKHPEQLDRYVRIKFGETIESRRILDRKGKDDFRILDERIRAATLAVDDVLVIERAAENTAYDFEIAVLQPVSPGYKTMLGLCIQKPDTSNTKKRFGWYRDLKGNPWKPARVFILVKQGRYIHGFLEDDAGSARSLYNEKRKMQLNTEIIRAREEL